MNKEKCYFFTPKRCNILKEKLCNRGKCPFYKTTLQFRADCLKYPPRNYEKVHRNDKK